MSTRSLHERARRRQVSPLTYWGVRSLLLPIFRIYLRMERRGGQHIPRRGPVILAANHRSFLDPFVIVMLCRRPLYYVAKRELFARPWQGRLLSALGAFPVARGTGDAEMFQTARAILARGDVVLIFPEGTRIRDGGLASPRRGVGRLALETGAPVVPVAVIGSERVRRGWRIRSRKVAVRAGRALRFPRILDPSPEQAAAVVRRVWPLVSLQWEWLGGVAAAGSSPSVVAPERVEPARVAGLSHQLEVALVPACGVEAELEADATTAPARAGRFRRA